MTAVAAAIGTVLVPLQSAARQPVPSILVTGSVRDIQQGTPVPLAQVELRWASDEAAAGGIESAPPEVRERTDESGAFRTSPLPEGDYRIVVRALGYRDLSEPVRVEGASPMELTIRLVPEAMELDPVVVRGVRSRRLDDVGFYRRREQGVGRTFTHQEIQRRAIHRASDVFRTIAGARLLPAGAYDRPYIAFRGDCLPDIVLDGINLGSDVRLDEWIGAHEIEGLEVYRGSQAPLQYSTNGCGAVLVWSLDPTAHDGKPFTWGRLVLAAVLAGVGVLIMR